MKSQMHIAAICVIASVLWCFLPLTIRAHGANGSDVFHEYMFEAYIDEGPFVEVSAEAGILAGFFIGAPPLAFFAFTMGPPAEQNVERYADLAFVPTAWAMSGLFGVPSYMIKKVLWDTPHALLTNDADPITNATGYIKPASKSLNLLVQEYAFREYPERSRRTRFVVDEYMVPGLSDLGVQFLRVDYMVSKMWFEREVLIYSDGEFLPFTTSFGSSGLSSLVVLGSNVYYSYAWGSGIARGHIGQITVSQGKIIDMIESGGYVDPCDLSLKVVGERIQVGTGKPIGFNSCKDRRQVWWVKVKGSSLVIVDSSGKEIPPHFPAKSESQ